MARRNALCGLLVGFLVCTPVDAQVVGPSACLEPPATNLNLPNGLPFETSRIVALYRFHRSKEALDQLDAALATARGPWRWRLPPRERKHVVAGLEELRRCLTTTAPPPMATLTVRVLGDTSDAADHIGPQAGARVHVEGIPVGRTMAGGMLTTRVPSGPISVEVEMPISRWNSQDVDLAPGQTDSIDIGLSDGKEANERTVPVLDEAVDDIVPLTARTLTLTFVKDGHLAPVTRLDHVNVVDRSGNYHGSLDEHFQVVEGRIVAIDAKRVFEALAARFERTIELEVQAMAGENELHQGTVAFRVGQSPLSVTLAPPPSNPALVVSAIDVGISLVGAGIAVQRTSDARGRFQIESFPHGTVAFDCAVVSNGRYYYGQATLRHSGPRSATLVLLNVEDLKKGVAPLRSDDRD